MFRTDPCSCNASEQAVKTTSVFRVYDPRTQSIPETRIGLGLSLRNKRIIWPQSALPCVPEGAQSDKAPRKTTADGLHAAFWEGVALLCYVYYVLNTVHPYCYVNLTVLFFRYRS